MVDMGAIPPDGMNNWQTAHWPDCGQLKQKPAGMTRLWYMLYKMAMVRARLGERAVLVREGLAAQIYQHIRRDLMAGRYEPGQKLKLRDLADRLGTSVTPVREALARLTSDQVVVQVDHRSVCVAVMHLDQFVEMRELRLDLEGMGAERAATRATPSQILALRRIHARLLKARAQESYTEILLANQQFHLELCRCARMPVLLRLVEALWVQCGPLMHGMTRWPVARPTPHPHVAVIDALRARDGAAARDALRQDIMMSTDALHHYLTSHAERPEWAKRSLRDISTQHQTQRRRRIAGASAEVRPP
jgi:DNA-binding GntR family transcriptional regulator